MKNFLSYLRAPLIFLAGAGLLEYFVDSGKIPAFLKNPLVFVALILLLLTIAVFEASTKALEAIKVKEVTEADKAKYAALSANNDNFSAPSWLSGLTKAKRIEDEEEIVLNHNYDGIRELDNVLPPWWVYLFYATIIFAIIYGVRFMMNDINQVEEYNTEVVEAKAAFEEWKKTAKDYVDVSSVTLLTDKADLEAGKATFLKNCAVCHKPDAGGNIGPNLTDKYWLLGGGVKNIFTTISKGGRPNKGMEAWAKKGLKPQQIQQLASYIISLQGSNPAGAKKPQGEIWKGE